MAPILRRLTAILALALIPWSGAGCSTSNGLNEGEHGEDGAVDPSSGGDSAPRSPADASGAGPVDAEAASDSGAPDGNANSGSDSNMAGSDGASSEDGAADAGAVSCVSDAGDGGGLAVLRSQAGNVTVGFDVSVTGVPSSGGIGQIEIQDDVGTIELDGESVPVILYNDVSGSTSFQGIAVGASRWVIFWPYCTGTQLTWVDYETSDAPGLVRSEASGTCAFSASSVTFPFTWPAESVALNPSPASTFTMTGTSLSYAGSASGTVSFGGGAWTFWPFAEVDCTTCGSGPGDNGGWYELHSLLETGNCGTVCFGIFYLYLETGTNLQSGSPVELGWLNCLPELAAPPTGGSQMFSASWTNQ